MSNKLIPRVLLIGAGQFGENHLRVLQKLDRNGLLRLVGVVVKSRRAQEELSKELSIPVYRGVRTDLFIGVDAVDIVTPGETHQNLARAALKQAHVFVEKPLAFSPSEANYLYDLALKNKKVLMAGHIYRFHPVTKFLKKTLDVSHIVSVSGQFISPSETYKRGDKASFEELHLFDILDFLIGKEPEVVHSAGSDSLTRVEMRYAPNLNVDLTIGWRAGEKIRSLTFVSKKNGLVTKITADFALSIVTTEDRNGSKRKIIKIWTEPLEDELHTFINEVNGGRIVIGARDVVRVTGVAERASVIKKDKPKVAIIGGGIFGATAGLILAEKFEVDLFEREEDILKKASYANQYRHHQGFHYPRSLKTIEEIKSATKNFESFYRSIVVGNFPSYYCVPNRGSYTSPEQFLRTCKSMGLKFTEGYPPAGFLNRNTVSVSVKTGEQIYDYEALKSLIKKRMKGMPKLNVHLGHEVTSAKFLPDGRKRLEWINKNGQKGHGDYDIVINATYADYNVFCQWLGFPLKDLQYRFKELVLLDIDGPQKCAVTIMDGPFATLVPTGHGNRYTFGDVPLSVRKKVSRFDNHAFEKWRSGVKTKWPKMLERCLIWFPILKQARYFGSMYITLPVESSSSLSDARPTTVTSHGFGCYSVLSGKIITSVSTGLNLRSRIEQDYRPNSHI